MKINSYWSVCLSLQMQELCIVTVFLQMAALVIGTNINNVTKMTEQPKPPFKCFHQPPAACNGPGCTFLYGSEDTAVCCHLAHFPFKEKMAGTVSFSLSSRPSSSQTTDFQKQTDDNNVPPDFDPKIWISKCLQTLLREPGWFSRYSDSLRAGRSGHRIPVGARFSAPVQTGPGAQPASYTMGTGSLSWR
jgi:hypothetical protein